MSDIKLYNGDCLEVMRQIPDKSVDMVLCDLPYGTTACAWDSVIPFDKLWEQYRRICKPNAPIVLFGSEPFSTIQRTSNLKEFRYDWIWKKSRPSDFLHAKKRPMKSHEIISVFCRVGMGSFTYNPQGLKKCNRTINASKSKFGSNFRKWNNKEVHHQEFENYPTTILEYQSISGGFHPTQKPVDLLRYLIRTYTNEGDTVLDNCMGSGSTGVAAVMENRKFIGIELDENYFKIAERRIKSEFSQIKLF